MDLPHTTCPAWPDVPCPPNPPRVFYLVRFDELGDRDVDDGFSDARHVRVLVTVELLLRVGDVTDVHEVESANVQRCIHPQLNGISVFTTRHRGLTLFWIMMMHTFFLFIFCMDI